MVLYVMPVEWNGDVTNWSSSQGSNKIKVRRYYVQLGEDIRFMRARDSVPGFDCTSAEVLTPGPTLVVNYTYTYLYKAH